MNAKNKVIERLLVVAKKHKVLTYPVLALLAIISFFGYFFSWSQGAGKRIIAVIMVMVMLVSQSYFLTTSAATGGDTQAEREKQIALQEEAGNNFFNTEKDSEEQQEQVMESATETEETVNDKVENSDVEKEKNLQDSADINMNSESQEDETTVESSTVKYNFNFVNEGDRSPTMVGDGEVSTTKKNESGIFLYDLSDKVPDLTSYTEDGCYEFSAEWYYDQYGREKADLENVTVRGSMIRLYRIRKLLYCKVTIVDHNDAGSTQGKYQVTGGDLTGENVTSCRIPIDGAMTISNLSRTGYSFDTVNVQGNNANITDNGDGSFKIVFTGSTPVRQVMLNWIPEKYEIKYSRNEAGTGEPYVQPSVTYDGIEKFLSGEQVGVEEKAGYKFKGWKIGQTGSEIERDLISFYQDQLYQKDVILYPVYEYDAIKLMETEKSYEFGKYEDPILIKGSYVNSKADSSHFEYKIEGGEAALNAIGIYANVTNLGISLSTNPNGPTAVTSGPINLQISITDSKAPDDKSKTVLPFNVYVNKRKVNIIPPDSKSVLKVYDGTKSTSLGLQTLYTDVPGITVEFASAEYNSPNVDADKILLSGGKVKYASGLIESNYEVEQINGRFSLEGHIEPRTVYVRTWAEFTNGRDYTRTGEDNPIFKVEVDTPNNNSNDGFVGGDTLDSVGYTFSTNRPDDNRMQEKEYWIEVNFPSDSNYKVAYDNAGKGYFLVKQEMPELDINYQITGTKGNGDWYVKNLAVSPIISKGYDTIRVSTDGGANYISGFSINLNEADAKKGIFIQLYDSESGAVTGWKEINERVDQTPPKFISYSLSQDNNTIYESAPVPGGLYFPATGRMLTFGTYFNRTVTVTVKYRDTASGLSTLHYGLYGAPTSQIALFGETDEDGYATATFEIYQTDPERAGEINFFATDIAGNSGDPYRLTRDGASDWSVELSGATIENFYVTTGKKQQEYVENGSKKYYSNCTAFVEVTDKVSGIYSVAWDVNGTRYDEERVGNTNAKQTSWTFSKGINKANFPNENGDYSVYAVIEDNAGNEVITNPIHFMVDDEPPVVKVTSDYDTWQTQIKLEFDTYDELSGVDYINVTDADGNLLTHYVEAVENDIYHCYFEIFKKGTYYIIAVDKAGNVNKTEVDAAKVSNEIPECPDITVSPEKEDENDEWYTVTPSVTIRNITRTTDDTYVTTRYQLWKEGEAADDYAAAIPESENSAVISIPDGIYNLKAWSRSMTGVQCAGTHEYQMKVDTILPKIEYTTKGSGSTILVDFTVTDSGSGVDGKTVKILHNTKEFPVKLEETKNGYSGSFVISETGNYSIQASDIAGNAAQTATFTPMSMKVKAVTNISADSVSIGASVIKGTFDITGTTLSYKKITDARYMEADSVINHDSNGNVSLSAVLSDLSEGTVYAYKVTAVSSAEEVLEYEGYFRTLSPSETGISVTGTARYPDNRAGLVTVGLFKGNVCYRAVELNAGDEFTFLNVPDGNYSIIATDGIYSKTKRVLIKDGVIIYPESYIDLILSGKNTSVVITTEDTPNITADNMDSIFDYDVINFTDGDVKLIEVGGTVEFKLYATLMSVSNVSANEISAMYNVTDKNKIVGAYLDLSLYKVVTDSNGEVERSKVTELANGANVSVTIPLGELSGKLGLEVIRIHDTGDSNYLGASLQDQDNNPATYTVTTNQFSTYAVLYNRESAPTTEDKKPSDGKDNPTTEDKKPSDGKDNPTTEDKKPNDGKDNPTTEDKKPNDGKDNPTTEDKKPNGEKDNHATDGTNGSSIGSLRSSGAAKTGDEVPIAVMGTMMLLSGAGFFVLKRKLKQ